MSIRDIKLGKVTAATKDSYLIMYDDGTEGYASVFGSPSGIIVGDKVVTYMTDVVYSQPKSRKAEVQSIDTEETWLERVKDDPEYSGMGNPFKKGLTDSVKTREGKLKRLFELDMMISTPKDNKFAQLQNKVNSYSKPEITVHGVVTDIMNKTNIQEVITDAVFKAGNMDDDARERFESAVREMLSDFILKGDE